MTNPSIEQNRKQTDPTLADLMKLHTKEIMLGLNCHAIATVQSFDATKQTVTATINYKKSVQQRDADGTYKTVLVDYPILLDVPVVILSGGSFYMSFPIVAGDECLILFNDRDLDNWFQSGQVGPVASSRLHSFSDGIALVGIRSAPRMISGMSTSHAGIFNGATMVGISADKVKIANTLYTLNGLLQDLLTQIQLITVVCAAPSNPSGPPINAAAISAIATQIGALLE